VVLIKDWPVTVWRDIENGQLCVLSQAPFVPTLLNVFLPSSEYLEGVMNEEKPRDDELFGTNVLELE
jgi:hypothetical protein